MQNISLVKNTIFIALLLFTISLIFTFETFDAKTVQTKPCSLVAPKYYSKGSNVVFEISINCDSVQLSGKPFPVGADILVGLTVYAKPNVNYVLSDSSDRILKASPKIVTALKRATQSKSILVAGAPKWIVLKDSDSDSYDFDTKIVRIEKSSKQISVMFQGDKKTIAGKQHLLFAIWSASDRKSCNKRDKYKRSGCTMYGYVIGSDAGVRPIAAYPGLEINHISDDWFEERWIVERFR
ncbi:hypothetical protein [Anabaena sp. AL93]|jgi:hypothetical protein|uniref:hypothetical protein n=1 Tax=Anabaena sp. AL93 TaxID=1678133 RepID=UPI0007FEF3C2|nr:hypothetical protein [Anabaena sp. AL93]OBQ15480.1 MAG: hypothetical protein AN486_23165 [Anabaena sp. AL93]